MDSSEAIEIYKREIYIFDDLREYGESIRFKSDEEKKRWVPDIVPENYGSPLEFYSNFWDGLKNYIFEQPGFEKTKVLYRGVSFNSENKVQNILKNREFKSLKFDSFTDCIEVAVNFSDRKNIPLIFVAYFPEGSHLAEVEHEDYNIHEYLAPPENKYTIINSWKKFHYEEYKLIPKEFNIVLICLTSENDKELESIETYSSTELERLEELIDKKPINSENNYFGIRIQDLDFTKDDMTKIFSRLQDIKKEIEYFSLDFLIYDDLNSNCFTNKINGKYSYYNAIFEVNKNIRISIDFPSGYTFNYEIMENKLGAKYYFFKVSL